MSCFYNLFIYDICFCAVLVLKPILWNYNLNNWNTQTRFKKSGAFLKERDIEKGHNNLLMQHIDI